MSTEDGQIFYDEGDMYILSRPEDGVRKRFKVHKHVLQASPVFEDMFALGATNPIIDEVPVVEVDDNHEDLVAMFYKLYERHRQYKPLIPDLTEVPICELIRLALILDKYSCGEDAAELQATIDCQLEDLKGEFDLGMSVLSLPYLARLNHQSIQKKLADEVGWALERSSQKELDEFWADIDRMDARSFPKDLYVQLIERCVLSLIERQKKQATLQNGKRKLYELLTGLSQPVKDSGVHQKMACWIGVTSPAWQEAARQVLMLLWRKEADVFRKPGKTVSFDKGKDKERGKALQPLKIMVANRSKDEHCYQCISALQSNIGYISSLYPSWLELAPSPEPTDIIPPLEVGELEGDTNESNIVDSRLFNLERIHSADLHILSSESSSGRRIRFSLHKSLAELSPVLRGMLNNESRSLDAEGFQTIELAYPATHINALLRCLYNQNGSKIFDSETLRMADNSGAPFAFGYVMLKKLRFEKYVGEVRGILRQLLISSSGSIWTAEVLVALLQHADEDNDYLLRELVFKCFQWTFADFDWSGYLSELPLFLHALPVPSMKDLLLLLLKTYTAVSIATARVQEQISQVGLYVTTICNKPQVSSDHSLYACYKLQCIPAWMALRTSVMSRFCEAVAYLTIERQPITQEFQKEVISSLDALNIGTDCDICRKAVDGWIEAVKNIFREAEESRKRKRALDDEGERSADTSGIA